MKGIKIRKRDYIEYSFRKDPTKAVGFNGD